MQRLIGGVPWSFSEGKPSSNEKPVVLVSLFKTWLICEDKSTIKSLKEKDMDIYEVIKKRRSVRSYKPDPVKEEKIHRLLEAARLAPSAANRQPLCFVVVKDENTRLQLKKAYDEKWFYTAPLIICACYIPEKAWKRGDGKNYADIDAVIAMDHLIMAATAEGLATCWIAAFKPQFVKSILNLPAGIEPVAMTPVGYPREMPEPTYRKPMEEMVTFI